LGRLWAAPDVHPAKARRIAVNIAKLPELVGRGTQERRRNSECKSSTIVFYVGERLDDALFGLLSGPHDNLLDAVNGPLGDR
jgi:hypothetical protein